MTAKYIVLRLKTETKKASTKPYNPKVIIDIEETVAEAIKAYKIKDNLFEVSVKTKNNIMKSCYIKMSYELYKYFIRAYGSKKELEKDYEIIKKYS